MASTFRRHFDEDIARAESLLRLANGASPVIRNGSRADDVRLAAVAMSIGAMDAYFCDAYVDCLAKRLQSYKRNGLGLPPSYSKRNLPTEVLLNPSQELRPDWSLRMAAREVMERENVLDLESVTSLFNPVLPQGSKLWPNVMEPLIAMDWKRLTGIAASEYAGLAVGKPRQKARRNAVGHMKDRIGATIQVRHDWIHNCGRPRNSVQTLTAAQSTARIREVKAVVVVVDDHLMAHRVV